MHCTNCGARLAPDARFCQRCAAPVRGGGGGGGGASDDSRPAFNRAWLVAGAVVAALIAVVVVRFTGPVNIGGGRGGGATAAPPGAASTDISNMSPRERADRLFNRVMSAAERGDTANVTFFAPMAAQAYLLLDRLDADARYHLALIYLTSGDLPAAASQADSLKRSDPTHLFGPMIGAEVARRRSNQTALVAAYREFLANYEREMASAKAEYGVHSESIGPFLVEARRVTGAK